MYSQEQYLAWVIELSNVFVARFGYQVVSMAQDQSETWLVNPKMSDAPILLISARPTDVFHHLSMDQHRQTIATVFQTAPVGINISVNDHSVATDARNILITSGATSVSPLLSMFPDIDTALTVDSQPLRARKKAFQSMQKTMQGMQRKSMLQRQKTTVIFTLITSLVFIIGMFLSMMSFDDAVIAVMLGGYYKSIMVQAGEYFRLLTSGFVHISIFHLLINLMALRNLGAVVEPIYGSKKTAIALLGGIVLGNMFVFVMNESVLGVGLSGGLFALMGLLVVYLFESGAIKNPKVRQSILITLGMNLMISILPGISWAAHLGGFQCGLLLGFIYSKRPDWNTLKQGVTYLSIFFVVILAVLMFTKQEYIDVPALNYQLVNAWDKLGLNRYAQHLARAFGK